MERRFTFSQKLLLGFALVVAVALAIAGVASTRCERWWRARTRSSISRRSGSSMPSASTR